MRLYKFPKVIKYLTENEMVDERKIWCYAQLKAKVEIYGKYITIYGLSLICIKDDSFFVYYTEAGGSTELSLVSEYKICEMKEMQAKKHLNLVRFTFVSMMGDEYQLDMDDWKRFSDLFPNVRC